MDKMRWVVNLAIGCLGLTACLSPHGVRVSEVDPTGWRREESVELSYDNEDSLSRRTLSLVIRYDDRYPYDCLPLWIETITPGGEKRAVGVSIELPHSQTGKTTKYNETEQRWKDSVVLSRQGDYRFRVSHALPEDEVVGISAVGIQVK